MVFPGLYLLTAAPNSDLYFRLLQLKPCPMKTIYKFTPEVPVVEQKYDWGGGEGGGAGVRGCKAADYLREAKEKGRGKQGGDAFITIVLLRLGTSRTLRGINSQKQKNCI